MAAAFVIVVLAVGLYFLPCIIAGARHRIGGGIVALNVLLGWTAIGWLLALVLALTGRTTRDVQFLESTSVTEELRRLEHLHDDGVITTKEYVRLHSRLTR